MIVRPAGIDAGRFLAYRSTDQVFGLSHPRSGSFAHEWRVTLQTRLLSLPFATAPAGGCPEATTTRRRPYAQASHPEEGGRVSIQGLAGKSIWTSIGQRGTIQEAWGEVSGCDAKMSGWGGKPGLVWGQNRLLSAQKQHFLQGLMSSVV